MDHNKDENNNYELRRLSSRAMNRIIRHINSRSPKKTCDITNRAEEEFFDNVLDEAERHLEKYGFWPVFELCEIDYDDPILDIYPQDSIEQHKEERRRKRETGK